MEYFSQPEQKLSICALQGAKPSPEEMLNDLKKYSDPAQAEIIDRMLNFLHMSKFLEKYRELEKSPEFSQMMHMMQSAMGAGNEFQNHAAGNTSRQQTPPPQESNNTNMPDMSAISSLMNQMKQPGGINQLKNMLTPEQRQMYETLAAMNQQNQN